MGPTPLMTGQWSADPGPLQVTNPSQLLTIRLGRSVRVARFEWDDYINARWESR